MSLFTGEGSLCTKFYMITVTTSVDSILKAWVSIYRYRMVTETVFFRTVYKHFKAINKTSEKSNNHEPVIQFMLFP